VIKKPRLPQRLSLYWQACPVRLIYSRNRHRAFQSANPRREDKIRVPPNEKVNVIRHDHVTVNRNIMLSRSARRVILEDGGESI
jgi:hypothetical protein